MSERALESDAAVREADLRGVLAFLQIRHGAWLNAAPDNPHKPIYAEASDSAIREVLWRFEQGTAAAPPPDSTVKDVEALEEALGHLAVLWRRDAGNCLEDDVYNAVGTVADLWWSLRPDLRPHVAAAALRAPVRGEGDEREAARVLAMLGMQSDRYANDPDFRDAVDDVLAAFGQPGAPVRVPDEGEQEVHDV